MIKKPKQFTTKAEASHNPHYWQDFILYGRTLKDYPSHSLTPQETEELIQERIAHDNQLYERH